MNNESQIQGDNPKQDKISDELLNEAQQVFSNPVEAKAGNEDRITSRSPEPNNAATSDFARHVHTYTTEYIKLADQKAAFVCAINSALLCYLFKNDFHEHWLKKVSTWTVLDFMCFIAMLTLAIGLCLAGSVIVPRLRQSHTGFVFFNSVAEYKSANEYSSEVIASLPIHLNRAILKHIYDLAGVCKAKYWKLTISLWATSVGIILSLIFLFGK